MAQVETTIDSIRVAAGSPERTILLKQREAESYLPFWVSSSQADILAAQLQGRPGKSVDLGLFLANINAASSDIKCVTVHLEDNAFYAKILLSRQDKPYEVKCPMGIALALACRADAPILVDEALFDKAGVCFPPTPCQPRRKQPWWRRLFKSHQPDASWSRQIV
jgi:bifunctional DNase/RNase